MSSHMEFDKNFVTSNIALRIIGGHPASYRGRSWKIRSVVLLVFNAYCFIMLFYSVFLREIPEKRYSDACKNIAMLSLIATIVFKYSILVIYQPSIMSIINVMNNDYKLVRELTDEEKKIVADYVKRGVLACRIWFIISCISSTIFPLKAILLMIHNYSEKGKFELIPIFEVTYPGVMETYKNEPVIYLIYHAVYAVFAVYAITAYAGFDPLMPSFLLHLCGQLDVASKRMLKLYSESSNEEEVEKKLKTLIVKLNEIYSVVESIKKAFTILNEFSMKSTTYQIPLVGYRIVVCLRSRDYTNLEFIPLFFGSLVHFYMPCYYSDLLMEKSEDLRQAIYACGWELQPNLRTRKLILIMLTRATRPMVIRSVFYPICLDTFSEMVRTAYTIFNLMSASIQSA